MAPIKFTASKDCHVLLVLFGADSTICVTVFLQATKNNRPTTILANACFAFLSLISKNYYSKITEVIFRKKRISTYYKMYFFNL
jgi:hypothetical protein